MRDTGKPVEGHVDAPTIEQAYRLMADNGILCQALHDDPPGHAPPGGGAAVSGIATHQAAPASGASAVSPEDAEVASAIDSALDVSSTQVNVDDLWKRYRGQRVRVIDRDKIRQRVLSVITNAMRQSPAGKDTQNQTLERVEQAINKMFGDARNLTSEVSPTQAALEDQITRLSTVVLRLEKQLAQLTMAMRRGGGGGGAPSGRLMKTVRDAKNEKVLLEIFESNLELQRAPTPAPGNQAKPSGTDAQKGSTESSTPSKTQHAGDTASTSPPSEPEASNAPAPQPETPATPEREDATPSGGASAEDELSKLIDELNQRNQAFGDPDDEPKP